MVKPRRGGTEAAVTAVIISDYGANVRKFMSLGQCCNRLLRLDRLEVFRQCWKCEYYLGSANVAPNINMLHTTFT